MVHHLLKDGGKYVFRTPHPSSGPTDVSGYFCDTPEGFHLKEWQFQELKKVIKAAGFSRVEGFWFGKGHKQKLPFAYFSASETLLAALPRSAARKLGLYLCPTVMITATK